MSIEPGTRDLARIATALERIADAMEQPAPQPAEAPTPPEQPAPPRHHFFGEEDSPNPNEAP